MVMKSPNSIEGRSTSPFIILMIMFIVVCACATTAYTLYTINNEKAAHAENAKPDSVSDETSVEGGSPVYVPIDAFTVSLRPDGNNNDNALNIGLTLRVKNKASKSIVEKFLPEVRSRILGLLTQETFTSLSDESGRGALLLKIKAALSEPYSSGEMVVISDILLNAFILR